MEGEVGVDGLAGEEERDDGMWRTKRVCESEVEDDGEEDIVREMGDVHRRKQRRASWEGDLI